MSDKTVKHYWKYISPAGGWKCDYCDKKTKEPTKDKGPCPGKKTK